MTEAAKQARAARRAREANKAKRQRKALRRWKERAGKLLLGVWMLVVVVLSCATILAWQLALMPSPLFYGVALLGVLPPLTAACLGILRYKPPLGASLWKRWTSDNQGTPGLQAAGGLLLVFLLIGSSLALCALATQRFAQVRFEAPATVEEVTSGKRLSHVRLKIPSFGQTVVLRRRGRRSFEDWREGEPVCVRGRTWRLGSVVDSASRPPSRCTGAWVE